MAACIHVYAVLLTIKQRLTPQLDPGLYIYSTMFTELHAVSGRSEVRMNYTGKSFLVRPG
jgi:hypothetical protein